MTGNPDKVLSSNQTKTQKTPPMTRVRFTLPQVKEYPDTRPSSCPHCEGVILHRRGQVEKTVKDLYVSRVTAIRKGQDKTQDGQGRWNDERTGTDPVDMER